MRKQVVVAGFQIYVKMKLQNLQKLMAKNKLHIKQLMYTQLCQKF